MKIKKYRPAFFEGFEDVYYDINSKEELLASELCKWSVDNGYEICFSKDKEDYGFIMAIREEKNEEGAEWADSHPQKGKVDIEAVLSWLASHINDYIVKGRDIDYMFDDLRKAMVG